MNFFKSVFSTEPEPSGSVPESESELESSPADNPNRNSSTLWGSVIDIYRKDFEEFRSGLKKETSVIREVASRAVKDLPASLEIGASVAQESLESVGQAIDDIGSTVWKSTAEIISHGRVNLLTQSDHYNSDSDNSNYNVNRRLSDVNKPYSRFEMQLHGIQSDYNTYCREPEDLEEYENWKSGFVFDDDERNREIESLVKENGVVGEIYREVVVSSSSSVAVDEETFWSRYFYKVHKLKQAEEARARLVKRAISMDDEEDLSWDFDEDEDEERNGKSLVKGESTGKVEVKKGNSDTGENDNEKVVIVEESCKDSDVSVVSTQPSMQEDLSWDEIEDIGSNDDDNKGGDDGVERNTSRDDLRKRLSAAEDDEDMSWDIEDVDEADQDKSVLS